MAIIVLLWGSLAAGCTAAARPPSAAEPIASPSRNGTPASLSTLTPIPGLQATLTALPEQPPMPAEQARPYLELRRAVEQCSDYHENRRIAILQQLDYVTDPATLPAAFLSMYGDQWAEQMVYGSAYLSLLEWKLAGRNRSSCLYPIGIAFNSLLSQLGRPAFPDYD